MVQGYWLGESMVIRGALCSPWLCLQLWAVSPKWSVDRPPPLLDAVCFNTIGIQMAQELDPS